MKLQPRIACLLLLAACGDNLSLADPGDDAPPPPPPPPPPPGIQFLDFALAIDITPDGRYAVFESFTSSAAIVQVYDTILGETVDETELGDPSRNVATGVSATRRISALHGMPVQAGIYSDATGWVDLGSPHAAGCGSDEISGAFDISADGHVVVGLAWNGCTPDAFRWSDATGTGTFTPLELLGTSFPDTPATPPVNRATVVSRDGRIAAGFAQLGNIDRSPAVWRADGTGFLLDPTATDTPGEVLSIAADGTLVAGISGNDGFTWTAATGMVAIPRLDVALPSDPIYPNAIVNGTVFGGIGSAFFSIPIAFAWTPSAGTRALADLVTAAGIALPEGMTLNSVLAASADGTVLIGTAMDADFLQQTFVLRLPAPI